ncbi:MAG: hypothetical protein ACYCW6_12830 [Candidatus Xenobia bacterium]
MKQLVLVLAAVLLMTVGGAAAPSPTPSPSPTPIRITLSDTYDTCTAPQIRTSHGTFEVSLGISHDGDPHFRDRAKGDDFYVAVCLYRIDGGHYDVKRITVATGLQDQVLNRVSFPHTVIFHDVRFDIVPVSLSRHYGGGHNEVQVTVSDR